MNEKKECKIVQDLLPNYIEKLTSTQTNQYIEEHIKNCDECKRTLENMQKEILKDTKVKNKKEVNYIKKYRNKMRILSLILLAIFFIFIVITARKAIIIYDLSKKAEESMKSTNYHKTTYSYAKGRVYKFEEFVLEDKKKTVLTVLTEQGTTIIQEFFHKVTDVETRSNSYKETPHKKIANLDLASYSWQTNKTHNPLYTENVIHLLTNAAIFSNVEEKTFEGKECYMINNFKGPYTIQDNAAMYVNKENGLVICSMDSEVDDGFNGKLKSSGCEMEYEFGTVTEKDFIEPDINDYEIVKE